MPAVDSRIKILDAGILLLQTESEAHQLSNVITTIVPKVYALVSIQTHEACIERPPNIS